ncbi:MAG TPA: MarR family winged helix-turn-helix transcriptional regulator [Steroidobacteraceae bacterium]|nr:MarR family winged helix-turn-helix transcriptional regulator [Steroidobacteraceae bacterium]
MRRNPPPARAAPLEDLIAVRIVRIAEVVARLATTTIEARVGLRNTDLRILNLLDRADGVTVNEIARRAHVDKAWVSRSLRHLGALRLVTRSGLAGDSRATVIRLTAHGRAKLARVRPLAADHERRLLAGIDKSAFKAQLERLRLNAEELLGGGPCA